MKRLRHLIVTALCVGGAFMGASLFVVALAGIEPDEGGAQILFVTFCFGCAVGAAAAPFMKSEDIF